jgi:hypothetical protein
MINEIYESQFIKNQIIYFIFSFLSFFPFLFSPFLFISSSFSPEGSSFLSIPILSPDDNWGRVSDTSGAAGDDGLSGTAFTGWSSALAVEPFTNRSSSLTFFLDGGAGRL